MLSQVLFLLFLLFSVKVSAAEMVSMVPSNSANYLHVFLVLICIIAFIFIIAFIARRIFKVSGKFNDQLEVLGGLNVGSKEQIVLIQVGEEQLLVGVSPGRVSKIHKLDVPLSLKSSPQIDFKSVLKRNLNEE